MTVYDVDTDVYTSSGQALVHAAEAWFTAIDAKWNTLAECGDMCGSYSEAVTWASGYDIRANAVIDNARRIAEATHSYGCVLLELAHLHELADHAAQLTPGPPPAAPPIPLPPILSCRVPLPSAGGPGNGLVDEGIGLVEQVGIVVPDGDTTLLARAADTWAQVAAAPEVTGLIVELDRAAAAFAAVTAPETGHIDEDVRAIKAAAEDTVAAAAELATSTREHHAALVEMRDRIVDIAEQLAADIALEAAITVTISALATVVTAGAASPVGAAIGAARLAAIVGRYAPRIRHFVDVFKAHGLGRGTPAVRELGQHQDELRRIADLHPTAARPPVRPSVPRLTQQDLDSIYDYSRNGHADINYMLRSGETPNAAQQLRIDDLNSALGKLPPSPGQTVRHTILDAEDIARYEPGGNVTERSFLSTSRNPNGAADDATAAANVEFQIVGQNGRDISQYARCPEEGEILFPSGTEFHVQNKWFDQGQGKWIIQMFEV